METDPLYGRAFVAGVVGGLAMSGMLAVARAAGMPAALEMMLGTMIAPPGPGAFALGLGMHMVISGLLGLLYAALFR
jgi:hypothetical protein